MSAQNNRIPIAQVAARIREQYNQPCTYNLVWRLVGDGFISAERVRSRLFLYEHQIPEVARLLGLADPVVSLPRRRRPSAA